MADKQDKSIGYISFLVAMGVMLSVAGVRIYGEYHREKNLEEEKAQAEKAFAKKEVSVQRLIDFEKRLIRQHQFGGENGSSVITPLQFLGALFQTDKQQNRAILNAVAQSMPADQSQWTKAEKKVYDMAISFIKEGVPSKEGLYNLIVNCPLVTPSDFERNTQTVVYESLDAYQQHFFTQLYLQHTGKSDDVPSLAGLRDEKSVVSPAGLLNFVNKERVRLAQDMPYDEKAQTDVQKQTYAWLSAARDVLIELSGKEAGLGEIITRMEKAQPKSAKEEQVSSYPVSAHQASSVRISLPHIFMHQAVTQENMRA